MRNSKVYSILTVSVFGILLLLPLLQGLFHIFPEIEVKGENRALAEKPQLKVSTIQDFPNHFDLYFNDHFPLRSYCLNISFVSSLMNHQSPIPGVIIGKEDFLYCGKEEKDLYEGTLDFSVERMEAVIRELADREAELRRDGIRFYVVVAPTAMEVYPEYLPDYMQRTEKTVTDLFCELMQARAPQVPFVYLKEELLKHKDEGRLYFKNDNHWNPLAGLLAAQRILSKMSEDFPQLPKNIQNDFILEPILYSSGNLGNMIVVGDRFQHYSKDTTYRIILKDSTRFAVRESAEKRYEPTPGFAYPWEYEFRFNTCREQQPKMVMIRDSYAVAVMPYLTPWFRESVYIFDAWQYGANRDIIHQERPDVVLLMMYEPHIRNVLKP